MVEAHPQPIINSLTNITLRQAQILRSLRGFVLVLINSLTNITLRQAQIRAKSVESVHAWTSQNLQRQYIK